MIEREHLPAAGAAARDGAAAAVEPRLPRRRARSARFVLRAVARQGVAWRRARRARRVASRYARLGVRHLQNPQQPPPPACAGGWAATGMDQAMARCQLLHGQKGTLVGGESALRP
eukprot:scaffold21903_cov58-Phaeocystis_antarctica.AAC.4